MLQILLITILIITNQPECLILIREKENVQGCFCEEFVLSGFVMLTCLVFC